MGRGARGDTHKPEAILPSFNFVVVPNVSPLWLSPMSAHVNVSFSRKAALLLAQIRS